MLRKLEIACFNLESALIAEKNGAHRIELCENYKEGGLFPSEKLITDVLDQTTLPVFVMIRPRPGDFIYTEIELKQMEQQIAICKRLNCDGIVFGVLNPDHSVNTKACRRLVQLAAPLPCTFHRAFDTIKNQESALEEIIACGFKRLLTSGNSSSALDGKNKLNNLIRLADKRIIIMPGGGIRSSNIKELIHASGAAEYHSAALLSGELADAGEIKELIHLLH